MVSPTPMTSAPSPFIRKHLIVRSFSVPSTVIVTVTLLNWVLNSVSTLVMTPMRRYVPISAVSLASASARAMISSTEYSYPHAQTFLTGVCPVAGITSTFVCSALCSQVWSLSPASVQVAGVCTSPSSHLCASASIGSSS